MPEAATLEAEQTTETDPLIARIEDDAREFAQQRAEKSRDAGFKAPTRRGENGKFVSTNDGPRAGQESVKAAEVAADGAAEIPAVAAKAPEQKADDGGQKPEKAEDESKLSPYERAKRRETKAWKQINEAKLDAETRTAALAAREQALAARESAPTPTAANGHALGRYSAADYLAAAGQFEARAKQFEDRGQFDEADRENALAKAARDEAAQAANNPRPSTLDPRPSHEAALARNWAQLKADMPELTDVNSPVNRETVALLKANPGLLSDAAGPYRAVIAAGRKMVRTLEAEAAKVPELLKQVETLTKKTKELESLTSLPGGGGPTSRSGGGEEDFANLPADKREAILRREFDESRR